MSSDAKNEKVQEIRAARFEDYREYMLESNQRVLDYIVEQLMENRDAGVQWLPDKISQHIYAQFKQVAEAPAPDKFKHLRFSAAEKELLQQDMAEQLAYLQDEHSDLLNGDQDQPHHDSKESSPPPTRRTQFDMFAEFARHHANMLDRMIKENENRVRMEAQQRKKVTLKVETPKERVVGRQSY